MPNVFYLVIDFAHDLALALWVGGGFALGAIVAPLTFRLAPSRHDGGRIMASVLRRFEVVVLVCAAVLMSTSAVMLLGYRRFSPWYAIEYVSVGLMCASAVFGAVFVTPRLRALRQIADDSTSASVRGIDSLDTDLRAEFDRLHRLSVLGMQFHLACGTVALVFA